MQVNAWGAPNAPEADTRFRDGGPLPEALSVAQLVVDEAGRVHLQVQQDAPMRVELAGAHPLPLE
eukprot:2559925-Alexandrium_andersonii.AAC.1